MAENGPGGSWKVMEGSRSFRKVPQGSGQYHMRPTTLRLGGLGSPRGLAEIWVVGAPHVGGVLLGLTLPSGKVSLWEESQGDCTNPYCAPRGLLVTYMMRGGVGGVAHLIPKAYAPP